MIRRGTDVVWDWGAGTARGEVVEIHRDTVRRTIDGSSVTRHGSDRDPAYVMRQNDGTTVLKLRSEVRRADD
jgi:hypothetical protein